MIKANNFNVQNKKPEPQASLIREKPSNKKVELSQKNNQINRIKTSTYLEDLTNKGD